MPTESQIQELYLNKLQTILKRLERQRKSIVLRIVVLGLAILACVLAMFYSFTYLEPSFGFLFLVGIAVFAILLKMIDVPIGKYKLKYKREVLRVILKDIDPSWNYKPEEFVKRGHYMNSELFVFHSTMLFDGDDLVEGAVGNTRFQISEMKASYQVGRYDYRPTFKGLFAHIDFNKRLQHKTFILPDTAEKMLGRIGKKLQKDKEKGQLVNLENQEFEKEYLVFGTNQVEARYVLTPAMMESILEVTKIYGKRFYLSFIENKAYIAMRFKEDLFEPRLFKSGLNIEHLEKAYHLFSFVQKLIQEMSLNTRIWTKE